MVGFLQNERQDHPVGGRFDCECRAGYGLIFGVSTKEIDRCNVYCAATGTGGEDV